MRIVKRILLAALVVVVMLLSFGPAAPDRAVPANVTVQQPDPQTEGYCRQMSPWMPMEEEWIQQQASPEKTDLRQQNAALEQTIALFTGQGGGTRLEDQITGGKGGEAGNPALGKKKFVYLTFDDGPSKNTPRVLDILKQNDIKATFFVVRCSNGDYYKQIVADGHTLALHTYTHNYSRIYASDEAFFADLQQISDYVKSITGVESKIMRFAGGSSNTVSRRYCEGIMSRLVQEVQERGYTYFDWNAQSMDAEKGNKAPAALLKNVESFTNLNGSQRPYINLLLHNGPTEGTTADALQSIIDYYRGLGYEFRPITPDTPPVHQRVQN